MKIFQLFKLAVSNSNLVNNVVNDFKVQVLVGHSIFLFTVTSFYAVQLDFSVMHSEPILKGKEWSLSQQKWAWVAFIFISQYKMSKSLVGKRLNSRSV